MNYVSSVIINSQKELFFDPSDVTFDFLILFCSRRNRARKVRQTRKSTQPVPSDVLEQITKHDELELSKSSDTSNLEETDGTAGEANETKKTHSELEGGKPSSSSSNPKSEGVSGNTGSSKSKDDESKPATMSSYRPAARPTSKILNAVIASQQSSWPPSSSEKVKMADVVEQKMKLDLRDSLIKSANCMWMLRNLFYDNK